MSTLPSTVCVCVSLQPAMALSSSFRERLDHMEKTRMQRISLLQAEKEAQVVRSQILASKLSNITFIEQKCLKLNQKTVSQQYIISSLKSKLNSLDSKYLDSLHQFRVLKAEVGELTELEQEKSLYLNLKAREMEDFRVQANNFGAECRARVDESRVYVKELNSSFFELQRNTGYQENSDLTAAEVRKNELVAAKEKLDRSLTSNYQTRAQFQKQLVSILIAQNKEERKPSNCLK